MLPLHIDFQSQKPGFHEWRNRVFHIWHQPGCPLQFAGHGHPGVTLEAVQQARGAVATGHGGSETYGAMYLTCRFHTRYRMEADHQLRTTPSWSGSTPGQVRYRYRHRH
ncbi:hypothetical protein F7P85_14320 [Kerstersia gyiorum]|nr:hypothetical protein F7P85_14320 [Kerstersia gyiorum]